MKQKVLFLSHWFPSEEKPSFGIFIKRHAESISLLSNLTVVHFDIQNSSKAMKIELIKNETLNYETYVIKVRSRFHKLFYFLLPLHFILFKKLIKKYKIPIDNFSILQSNIIFPNGILATKISKKYNIPQFHFEHWSQFNQFFKKNIYRKLGVKSLLNCKKVFCVSEFLKNEIISKNLQSTKIEIIPNIINDNNFQIINPFFPKDKIVFTAIANWGYPKTPIIFLEALNQLKDKFHFEVNLIGDGPLLANIKGENFQFRINYLGQKNEVEINLILNNSNFLVHSSAYETFSIVIVESLLSGIPVICNNIGISSEIINENNGSICIENTIDSWKSTIESTIQRTFIKEEIKKQIGNSYSAKKIGEKIIDSYNEN